MTYGVRTAGDVHHLDIGEDIAPTKSRFPQGFYDGERARASARI